MAHGFFTLEQWRRPSPRAKARWVAVKHFSSGQSISQIMRALEAKGAPGFYRIVQTQRMIWAEKVGGKLRLRKWHAGAVEVLERGAAAFERDGGRWPVAKKTRKSR